MPIHPLLDAVSVDRLEPYLTEVGEIFQAFREQDSGCVSYGVRVSGERWFVKGATTAAAAESLRRAVRVHSVAQHSGIVPLRHHFAVRDGLALVHPWVDGQVLYQPTVRQHGGRDAPNSPLARFRRLPTTEIVSALDTVLAAHVVVERAGLVAVDFYDGCMIYDFDAHRMMLCDLDEYRPGPFTLKADRLPGSRRFMAPEEFTRGARIDTRTTVHALGRTFRLLLDAGDQEQRWRGGAAQLTVIARATAAEPARRHPTVEALAQDWRAACSSDVG
ncbi:serine/threonine protein kinase [Streptomyces sp. NBC_00829]|uniref:serine/threonine protein kinase n=1 Tax=Streptomyces sp. NBC_00829 TaxID=2903679 RepID=UPI0038667CB3|nr:serine/threonine protein kinase [Streptomyces sp. NBC_00829]